VSEPSIEKIIERLQFCIVDARAMQLKMLERVLSISLLEAHELKEASAQGSLQELGQGRINRPH
jgi:hypothetical protein